MDGWCLGNHTPAKPWVLGEGFEVAFRVRFVPTCSEIHSTATWDRGAGILPSVRADSGIRPWLYLLLPNCQPLLADEPGLVTDYLVGYAIALKGVKEASPPWEQGKLVHEHSTLHADGAMLLRMLRRLPGEAAQQACPLH